MSDFFVSMTYPFLACLLLAGIHVYLGIHVIERKVIFVDLALAQIASLGAIYGILLGYDAEHSPWMLKLFSFGLAAIAAAVFSFTRTRHERVPQEAVIGIAYAAAVSAGILASTNLPHGADELRELLAGSILWVTREDIVFAGVVYAAVGVFHFVFRGRFLAISFDAHDAERRGVNVPLWDFLFYMSFALVVTSSVAIAGVLLVFAFLVVPAVTAVLLADHIRTRLLIGWLVGAFVSLGGLALSYVSDLPSGPVIVLALISVLVAVALAQSLARARDARSAALQAALAIAVLVVAGWSVASIRATTGTDIAVRAHHRDADDRLAAIGAAGESPQAWHELRSHVTELLADPDPRVRSGAAELIGRRRDADFAADLHARLSDADDSVRESTIRAIRTLHLAVSIEPLLAAAHAEADAYLRTELAEAVIELGDPRGVPILIAVVDGSDPRQVRKEAYEHLAHHMDVAIPAFDADKHDLSTWWSASEPKLSWNAKRLTYERR